MPSFEKPSGFHKKTKKIENPLEVAARSHPDFAKFETLLSKVDKPDTEDALEHIETATPERLAFIMSEYYWAKRFLGKDASGFNATGDHDKKPQEFASECGIDIQTAKQIFEEAKEKIDSEVARSTRYNIKFRDIHVINEIMTVHAALLREEIDDLRRKLREAA